MACPKKGYPPGIRGIRALRAGVAAAWGADALRISFVMPARYARRRTGTRRGLTPPRPPRAPHRALVPPVRGPGSDVAGALELGLWWQRPTSTRLRQVKCLYLCISIS